LKRQNNIYHSWETAKVARSGFQEHFGKELCLLSQENTCPAAFFLVRASFLALRTRLSSKSPFWTLLLEHFAMHLELFALYFPDLRNLVLYPRTQRRF